MQRLTIDSASWRLIEKAYGSPLVGLDAFLDFLRAFHIACNSAIKQLSDPSTGQSGDAWNSWLSRLGEILETEKSLAPIIWELQKCLPPEYRRDLAVLKDALCKS